VQTYAVIVTQSTAFIVETPIGKTCL